jgi:hypothetical protein
LCVFNIEQLLFLGNAHILLLSLLLSFGELLKLLFHLLGSRIVAHLLISDALMVQQSKKENSLN